MRADHSRSSLARSSANVAAAGFAPELLFLRVAAPVGGSRHEFPHCLALVIAGASVLGTATPQPRPRGIIEKLAAECAYDHGVALADARLEPAALEHG